MAEQKGSAGRTLVGLKRREGVKRGELAKIIDAEKRLSEKEYSLASSGRKAELKEEGLLAKEPEGIRKLSDLIDSEKKLLRLEVSLEDDREDVIEGIRQVRVLRERLRERRLASQGKTEGWDAGLPDLKPGNIYLVDEHDILVSGIIPSKSIELFTQSVESGSSGLYVTRSNPKYVLKEIEGLVGVDLMWMTESKVVDSNVSTVYTIEHLSLKVTKYLQEKPRSIVLLDGLEYLISNIGFDVVLPFVQSMRDYISTIEAIVVIPINSDALPKEKLSMLSRECFTLE